jgi:hypothetical protein
MLKDRAKAGAINTYFPSAAFTKNASLACSWTLTVPSLVKTKNLDVEVF